MVSRADARRGPPGMALLSSADHLFADPLKLTTPPWRDGLVERSTLVDDLLAHATVPLVVIAAPTGYGKTTTMAQWARSERRRVGWVLLDELDNDPVRFVRHLALALDGIETVAREVMDSLIGPAPSLDTVVLPRLVRSLRDGRSPFVLFLDDVHLLVNPASLEILRTLVDRLPFGSQVVVGGRSTPDLSTGRLRLDGHVRHVGPDELAMDLGEADQLYRFLGGDPQPSDLPTLLRITEGWPAGIALAALASTGGRDAAEPLATFGGDHRFVAEYLRDELLSTLDDELADFLLGASVLSRLTGPRCDELLEVTGSGERLEGLVRARNLFVVPLDGIGGEYRFHHMFSELLQSELHARDGGREIRLHARASEMYERAGDPDSALRHALAAGDVGRAATLVHANAVAYASSGRNESLGLWLTLFDERQVATRPELGLATAWYRVASGDAEELEQWISLLAAHTETGPLPDGSPSLEIALASLRALVGIDGVVGLGQNANTMRDGCVKGSMWWTMGTMFAGIAASLEGQDDLARERLGAASVSPQGPPAVAAICLAHLALVESRSGSWDLASDLSTRAVETIVDNQLRDYLPVAVVYAVEERGSMLDSDEPIGRWNTSRCARRLIRTSGHLPARTGLLVHVLTAEAQQVLGNTVDAEALLGEAERTQAMEPDALMLNQRIDTLRALLDAGRRTGGAARAASLTTAELHVLERLPTHLSLQEIADELFVSRNTVKSQAIATYRKLGVSSRGDAVVRARALGLIPD